MLMHCMTLICIIALDLEALLSRDKIGLA
uniref:Uncharacterized protein n=1 Tax=Rhizophora mucronata TaxID=61149 RepID=A0A2P2PXJ8_RHIMU